VIVRPALIGTLLVLAVPAVARAQSVAEFYRGKTIEMLIGGAVGGGYDLAGRTVANHMGRHIPGNPGFVVRNLPGATSLIMTNQLYNGAKRDGTVIGMPTSNIPLEQRLKLISPDGANVKFDITRFGWIGTPVQEPQITWVWHTAPAQNLDDLRTNTIRMGGTTSSADNYLLPTIVNQLLGTRMQTVTGYIGQNEIFLATERGEVQGNNTGLSNITVNKADWLRDGKVRILLQYGTERLPSLPNVPTVIELAQAEARPRAAPLLCGEVQHGTPPDGAARCAGGPSRRAARRLRRHHEGSAIPRRGAPHRPRRQSARRRRDRKADPAGPGHTARRGRSLARTARAAPIEAA
jgi:tripartite-type tricarboxylate transporter receptor subunit TctC